jgi:hypothetical protein
MAEGGAQDIRAHPIVPKSSLKRQPTLIVFHLEMLSE